MIKSFSNWSSVNEALAQGKEELVNPVSGKKHKVKFKVQDTRKFIIKIVNDLDVLDEAGRLTPGGQQAIVDFLNSQESFVRTIGTLSPKFFQTYFIVYTVVSDGEIFGRRKQKIQFSVENRLDASGNPAYPTISAGTQFVHSDTFKAASTAAPAILQQLTTTATQTILPDPEVEQAATQAAAPAEVEETKKLVGKKFLYTMRANSKLYMMTFDEKGALVAKTKDESKPNGIVSYDATNKKVLWNTEEDDRTSKDAAIKKANAAPLFTDSEITNSQDKTFFEKIFTDDKFRDKIIAEYEAEYGSLEFTPENLKRMLFYKDGTPIFSSEETAQTAAAAETPAAAQASSLSQEQIDKIVAKITAARQALNQPQ